MLAGFGLASRPVLHPSAEFARDGERLRRDVGGSLLVRVEQAGEHLVEVVERHEQAVAAAREHARRERRDVAGVGRVGGGVGVLSALESVDRRRELRQQLRLRRRIGRRGVRLRQRGDVVAEEVALEACAAGALPAAVRLRGRRQAGLGVERVEEPLGVEAQQVLDHLLVAVDQVRVLEEDLAQLGLLEVDRSRGTDLRHGDLEGLRHWHAAAVGPRSP